MLTWTLQLELEGGFAFWSPQSGSDWTEIGGLSNKHKKPYAVSRAARKVPSGSRGRFSVLAPPYRMGE